MNLPIPDQIALKHSEKLAEIIRREIKKHNGSISFAHFMQLALYAPGFGYYSAGSHKIGRGGDFITAPEISPLFTRCIARQCHQVIKNLPRCEILEIGAGSGVFAKDVLLELEELDSMPRHYYILEISAELRERQRKTFEDHCPDLLPRLTWLSSLPKRFKGIIFANELMDAMPIHCFGIKENGIQERTVTLEKNQFAWHCTSPSPELMKPLQSLFLNYSLPLGYESEVSLMIPAWIKSLAGCLEEGIILLADYGYGRSEYYHPDRSEGTLMCFYQHHLHSDPFVYVGLQDITAHVDFTTVAESAVENGLKLAGYTTQASFLLASGLLELAQQKPLSEVDQYTQNQAIKKLTLPSQMGELVKFVGLTKNLDIPLMGFELHDRRRDL
jgi:SAM-dependent MidA family methyltransferase